MTKAVKNKWVGARADEAFAEEVAAYIERVPELDMATLIRLAIREYIAAHPIVKKVKV